MEDRDIFVSTYRDYACHVLANARFSPQISIQKLTEAHGAWKNDLSRVGENEPQLDEGLDHFKRSGHLAFWLRRMSPLIEANDLTRDIADAEGFPLTKTEELFRELLFGYGNEYLAFDLGYQLCKFHEIAKADSSTRAKYLVPDTDYYKIICHFLKYKSVSPHAMYLIYKSLFVG